MKAGVLIIGIGNPLRRDDGFGPAVVDLLEATGVPGDVRLLCVHQLAPEIAEDLRDAQRAVFVDARVAEGNAPPRVRLAPLAAGNSTANPLSHEFPPAALLRLTGQLYGHAPEAWTLSVPALDLSAGEGLSPSCQAHAEQAARLLHEWLTDGRD